MSLTRMDIVSCMQFVEGIAYQENCSDHSCSLCNIKFYHPAISYCDYQLYKLVCSQMDIRTCLLLIWILYQVIISLIFLLYAFFVEHVIKVFMLDKSNNLLMVTIYFSEVLIIFFAVLDFLSALYIIECKVINQHRHIDGRIEAHYRMANWALLFVHYSMLDNNNYFSDQYIREEIYKSFVG